MKRIKNYLIKKVINWITDIVANKDPIKPINEKSK